MCKPASTFCVEIGLLRQPRSVQLFNLWFYLVQHTALLLLPGANKSQSAKTFLPQPRFSCSVSVYLTVLNCTDF